MAKFTSMNYHAVYALQCYVMPALLAPTSLLTITMKRKSIFVGDAY